ncbi:MULTISPECIES: HD domain-containing protein [Rufibacter]|uniref:Putative metal-dependent HD superfamily phosphohydrolase n=1 Tax=Rufibacter quisquiliarum TaxID=1549639 RepID=A0A839GTM1_9BACT|nr:MULTISPECIES: HD domain-containing protein [Rufibacter]MBA9077131.1 putative metal-dependent HD superfamily phosphohydrolase [Rufibacter quisquiliarum]
MSISLEPLYEHIVAKLREGLSKDLTYHSLHHTLDVFEQVSLIALKEGVTAPQELLLLQVAALYHDAGFLYTYQQHEERSCTLAKEELPGFGFTPEEITIICRLIMATQVPQAPQNKLQEIICDADLDYLGRDDFFPIGQTLFQEFTCYGVVQNEEQWNQLQVRFLESHTFFTSFSKNSRETQKQQHLALIKAKLNQRP